MSRLNLLLLVQGALATFWLGADVLAVAPRDEPVASWPQWRGPDFNGVAPRANPPVHWSETKNVRWKASVEGRGHSTPIVWGDRIFLVSAVPIEKRLTNPFVVPSTPRIGKHNAVITKWKPQALQLLCLDRKTGRTIWKRTVREVMPHQGYHWKGSFASASPIVDGEHVYAYFGSFGLFCYDFDGQPRWQVDLGMQAMEDGLGEGSSPALYEDKLVVVVDQELQSFVVALDKRTGQPLWRKNREEVSNWSTPLIFEHEGRAQVIVNGETVRCYDLSDGELL